MAETKQDDWFPDTSDKTVKELQPYFRALFMAQAAILEGQGFHYTKGEEPMDRDEILDWLLDIVKVKVPQQPVRRARFRADLYQKPGQSED